MKGTALRFPSGHGQSDHDRISSDLMKRNEAARYLRISRATLDRMKAGGNGPVWIRIGVKVLYRKRDLDDFIASQAQKERP